MGMTLRSMGGQIYPGEAEALAAVVAKRAPDVAVEIGTRCGDGSTTIIASNLTGGMLYTIESDLAKHVTAQSNVRHLPATCIYGESLHVLPNLLPLLGTVDFLLIDGAAGRVQVDELRLCEPYMSSKSMLCVHDYDLDKTCKLRQHLDAWAMELHVTLHGEMFQHADRLIEYPGIAFMVRK